MPSIGASGLREALAQFLRSTAAPLLELETDAAKLPRHSVGQIVQARVLAGMPGPRALLDIEGIRFDAKLPVAAQVGDTLELEVVALEPRLTLALLTNAGRGTDAVALSDSVRRLAAILDRLSAAPASGGSAAVSAPPGAAKVAANPTIAPGTAEAAALPGSMPPGVAALPGAGLQSAAVSGAALPMNASEAAATLRGPLSAAASVPVLPGAPSDTAVFADSLRTSLARSGLFYESHQAQWVTGQRPQDDLMQEPQAALRGTEEPVHPQTVGIVRQQLEALDTRQIAWQGHAWPGQPLEWRIEEEQRRDSAPVDAPRVWKTSLRLELPRLGPVAAVITISGNEVRMAFEDTAPDASAEIHEGRAALSAAFEKAGLTVLDISINRE